MEVFRELYLRGDHDQLVASMAEMERCLPPGWSRNHRLEELLQTRSLLDLSFCFSAEQVDHLPEADLYIVEKDDQTLRVSNIVPRDQSQLTIGQYNALLEEFHDQIALPCANKTGISVEMTSNHVDLGRWLSKTANRKLMAFSAKASRGTGASHPDDRRRWLDLVYTAHREESRLPLEILGRWLTEIEGWDPDVADRLVSEYSFGEEILSYSESQPA